MRREGRWRLLGVAGLALLVGCSGPQVGGEADGGEVPQACSEDQECEAPDNCQSGSCQGGVCLFEDREGECDDGDPCTVEDLCVAGGCQGKLRQCDDKLYCNGLELCDPATGECLDGKPPAADDGIDCTLLVCDEENDKLAQQPQDDLCDDQEQCTLDRCDKSAGCMHLPQTGPCDDGNGCTTGDSCASGSCMGKPVLCSDGTFCNGEESCDPASGECLVGEAPVADDGIACTVDSCDELLDQVLHQPQDGLCDDANQCTDELCDPDVGCLFSFRSGPCDDGEDCTAGELCQEGLCGSGQWFCFEECDNETDDDKDELVDCEDPDCLGDFACLPDGESCPTAYPLNLAVGLSVGDELIFPASTIGKNDDFEAPCSPASAGSPDTAHVLLLEEPALLMATVDFAGDGWPVLLVLAEDCATPLLCLGADSTAAVSGLLGLPAGSYFIVVDGNFVDGAGNGDAGDYSLELVLLAPEAEESDCTDGLDNDADGMTDCLDQECSEEAYCLEPQGDSCADPVLLFGGPVVVGEEPLTVAVEKTTAGMSNALVGSCDSDSANCPDMVFSLELAAAARLTASHDFAGVLYPALYLLDQQCGLGAELACAAGQQGAATISVPLAAGLYHLVVDGAYGKDAGPFELSVLLEALPATEVNCADGQDDDLDGAVDCDDEECAALPLCQGVPGESCAKPLLVNEGVPVGKDEDGVVLLYQGSTTGLGSAYQGSCDPDSAATPEAVYRLDLAAPMLVSLSHDFAGTLWPALYILDEKCQPVAGATCAAAFSDPAVLHLPLPAGIWFIVVDGAFPGESGPYTLTCQFASPPATESKCENGLDDDLDGAIDCGDDDCGGLLLCLDPYEPNATTGQASALGPLGPAPLATSEGAMIFPAGDEDWFLLTPDGPGFLWVALTPAAELDARATLLDSGGLQLLSLDSASAGGKEETVVPLYSGGPHFLVVKGFMQTVGSYLLELTLAPPDQSEGGCTDGIDADLDGLIDCDDDECAGSAWCGAGDLCGEPNLVNGGVPIGAEMVALELQGSTIGYSDEVTGSCSAASGMAPEAFWLFEVTAPMKLEANLDFPGNKYPALYVLEGGCGGAELACGAGEQAGAKLALELAPGSHMLVVDGNWEGEESPYVLTLMFTPVIGE